MRHQVLSRSVTWLLSAVLLQTSGFAQKPTHKPAQPPPPPAAPTVIVPQSGSSFFIGPVESAPGTFSVLLSEGRQSVTGVFSYKQIEVFEAVFQAAKEFAQSDEAVGKTTPIITRLMDQHEWSLFVDVSKKGDRSQYYVTLITVSGKLTVAAGEIVRGNKKEESKNLLGDILSKLKEAKEGPRPSN